MFLIRTIVTCRRVFFNLPLYVCCCLFIVNFCTIDICHGDDISRIERGNHSGLCVRKNATCSNQVAFPNVSEEDCKMVYHNRSSEMCSDENFYGDVDTLNDHGFSLLTFLYHKPPLHTYPAFNVSFSSVNWIRLVMRFKENPQGEESPPVSLCREFRVSPKLPPNFQIFFDCLWEENYQEKSFLMQYIVIYPDDIYTTYIHKYFFRVPDSSNINGMQDGTPVSKWKVFAVVDMSEPGEKLVLHVQQPPAKFNVSKFVVQLHRQLWGNGRVIVDKEILSDASSPAFSYTYRTNSRLGQYHFTIQIDHPDCHPPDAPNECAISKTPCIEIANLPRQKTLILLVVTVLLIPIGLMAYFLWRRKCEPTIPNNCYETCCQEERHVKWTTRKHVAENPGPPKFLLIYNPVSGEHVRTMLEVADYFTKVCHLHCMIDVLGIHLSEHKDPLKWYIECFNEADFVGIFASPEVSPSSKENSNKSPTVYNNTYAAAMSQLRQKICSPTAKCKFFGVGLPGTSWKTLPGEAQALKRYSLPRDLDPLLVLIGVVPQCDHGRGFLEALALARPERETLVLTLENGGVGGAGAAVGVPASAASTPTPTPVTCCAALSASDPDLVSTSQQVTSCLSTPASSDEQFSLLGD